MKTIIEPFRIKSVEPLRMTSAAERAEIVARAHYNLFAIRAEDVLIDLLTDSGTSAMSAEQWAALMRGDESYAGSASFERFEAAVKRLMPFRHVIPAHQGRAAEAILFSMLAAPGLIIPSNTHFDTTRSNIEAAGAEALDLPCPAAADTFSSAPFKGDIDLDRLEALLRKDTARIPCVMMTVTNNAAGGHPVSLANIEAAAKLARAFGKLFIIDGCRFAENAWLIKTRERGQSHRPVPDIVRDMFSCADGMTMSAKKDAFANIGGWLALNDDDLAREARTRLILTEGFPSYGGLAGRDLDAIAQGLAEIVDEDYLRYRMRVNEYVVERLCGFGVPVVQPAGGHAVFLDAKQMLPHIAPLEFPGQALAVALYHEAGVRGCEIGSVMFGRQQDGSEAPASKEFVRLAMPRRVYTQSHADYVIEAICAVFERRRALRGLRIVWEPRALRHFTAKFEPLA
ncbi:MAG: tryptophanase [Hyphomonadaceae bacterium]